MNSDRSTESKNSSNAKKRHGLFRIIIILSTFVFANFSYAETDPLPSWNNGKVKQSIIEFVQAVTNQDSKDFVPVKDRFATFDNDGTLWVEQPMYTQMVFMKNRFKKIADKQPQLYKSLNKDNKIAKLEDIYAVTSTEISTEDYAQIVKQWLATAEHPRFKRHYTDLVYQPMLEVMNYLRDNGFNIYIISGGGQDFIRAYSEDSYGVTIDHVVGSTSKSEYTYENNKPAMIKTRKLLFISDKAGKPEAIYLFIGKKPLIAFGNSTGDQQMLEWTQSGTGKRLMLLVHHDDAEREYAYDAESKIGTFPIALMQEAKRNAWQVISMKNDWKVIFPFEIK